MKITANLAAALGGVFALVCFGVAFTGFTSLGEITDSQQHSDALGFAWFWTFLGLVGITCGAASWWLVRNEAERENG